MCVLVNVDIDAHAFELGRVFSVLDSEATIELESLVPISGIPTPLVWISDTEHSSLEDQIGAHPTVTAVERIESLDTRSLYAFEWALEYDHLFRHFREEGIYLLAATGSPETWRLSLQFRTHKSLSAFQEYCRTIQADLEVLRVHNIQEQQPEEAYGITQPQQEALILAVREGYYDLPRGCDTAELAERLGISDQAVSERLRRAIATLTRNTLMADWK